MALLGRGHFDCVHAEDGQESPHWQSIDEADDEEGCEVVDPRCDDAGRKQNVHKDQDQPLAAEVVREGLEEGADGTADADEY
jgi:hypothetical protein